MAQAFAKTLKRDYAQVSPCPDAATVRRQLDGWFEHYNRASEHPSIYIIEEKRFC
jgi:putative transposase